MKSYFLNEAAIMSQFQHDHVIKFYGVITKVDPAMIVMEFMDNGSLYSYLKVNTWTVCMNNYVLDDPEKWWEADYPEVVADG